MALTHTHRIGTALTQNRARLADSFCPRLTHKSRTPRSPSGTKNISVGKPRQRARLHHSSTSSTVFAPAAASSHSATGTNSLPIITTPFGSIPSVPREPMRTISRPRLTTPRRWLTIYKPNYIAQQCNKDCGYLPFCPAKWTHGIWRPASSLASGDTHSYPVALNGCLDGGLPPSATEVPRHCAGHQPRRQPRDAPRRWYENNPT